VTEEEDEGTFATRGDASHEHDDALSPDERGTDQRGPGEQDVPPPSEPKGPAPR
jgi:hypothetical protein